MFKKVNFKGLDYRDLDRFDSHDLKRENLHSFYQTFDFLSLVQKWPEIVGAAMSKVTSPLKIKGDSLILVSKHSSYSQNISFLSEEIKQKIFVHFPQLRPIIRKLNFVTQESFFRETIQSKESVRPGVKFHPQDPRFKLLKLEADRLFAHIEDAELKALLTNIFLQSK